MSLMKSCKNQLIRPRFFHFFYNASCNGMYVLES